MAPPGPAAATLSLLQEGIHAINAVRAPPVVAFLVERQHARAAGAEPRAEEELLLRETEDGLDVGLFLDDGVLAAAARAAPGAGGEPLLSRRGLEGVASAAEGVSHFVYVATRADADRPVSLLELELQAEVDKFALFLLHGWPPGAPAPRRLSAALRCRLFERVRYHAHLDEDELARYRTANRLAAGYARWLEERYVAPRDREGLLRELRWTYRRGGAGKAAYLGSRC